MNLSIGKVLRDCPMHKHSYYQIIVYTQGTGTEYVDGKPVRFQPGTIFIIPPGVVHFSTQDGDIFEDIYMNGDLGHIFSLNTTAVVLDNSANEGVMLAKMIHANRLGNREYVAALTNAFFHFLLENIKLENDIFLAVKTIIEAINDNFYDSTIDLKALLNQSGYSEDYIRAQFKKVTGKTPTEFLTKVRIDHACHLIDLFKNTLPLSDVAEKCGYSDYVYFSRRFKQVTGISPKEYMAND